MGEGLSGQVFQVEKTHIQGSTSSPERKRWEGEWANKGPWDFVWSIREPPEELRDLVERGELPTGVALDVGCGAGIITKYLADHLDHTIGFDVAHRALEQGRQTSQKHSGRVSYLVAEAPRFPFKDGSFTFIFDRGCLHNIPFTNWPEYFEELGRVLQPNGLFQVYCGRPGRINLIPLRPLRNLLRRLLGRGDAPESAIPRFAEPSMQTIAFRKFRYLARNGRRFDMVYGLFRMQHQS